MEKEENEKLKKCEAERDEYLNGWKRAKADLVNYQNDEMRRLADALRRVGESWARELLPVLQSFDLGINAAKKNGGDAKGLEIIQGQLRDMLRRNGVEEVRAKPGDPFDPNIHEAVGETMSDVEDGRIAEVMGFGYKLGEKIVRAVPVKLSKKS